jgi:hypothetical protein
MLLKRIGCKLFFVRVYHKQNAIPYSISNAFIHSLVGRCVLIYNSINYKKYYSCGFEFYA